MSPPGNALLDAAADEVGIDQAASGAPDRIAQVRIRYPSQSAKRAKGLVSNVRNPIPANASEYFDGCSAKCYRDQSAAWCRLVRTALRRNACRRADTILPVWIEDSAATPFAPSSCFAAGCLSRLSGATKQHDPCVHEGYLDPLFDRNEDTRHCPEWLSTIGKSMADEWKVECQPIEIIGPDRPPVRRAAEITVLGQSLGRRKSPGTCRSRSMRSPMQAVDIFSVTTAGVRYRRLLAPAFGFRSLPLTMLQNDGQSYYTGSRSPVTNGSVGCIVFSDTVGAGMIDEPPGQRGM